MDCRTAISIKVLASQVKTYEPTFTGATAGTVQSVTTAFTNADSTTCPITGCTLLKADCAAPLDEPYATLLTIGALTPWTVKVAQTV